MLVMIFLWCDSLASASDRDCPSNRAEISSLDAHLTKLLVHDEKSSNPMEVVCAVRASQIERKIAYIRSFADIRDVREALVIAG